MRIFRIVLVAALAGCGQQPEVEPSAAPSAPVVATAVEKNEMRSARVRDLQRKITDLELALLEVEGELLECQVELSDSNRRLGAVERTEQELETAAGMAESERVLNRQVERASAPRREPSQAAERPPAYWVRGYSGPVVQVVGDRVQVSGKLWNSGDKGLDITLAILLYEDNVLLETARQRIRVGAGTSTPYLQKMRARVSNGRTYLARIEID